MQLRGYVDEIDPKEGRNGKIWLLKFKLVADDGPVWMGAYVDRKDAPRAFVQRAMAEADLPPEQRTIWDIEAEEVEERGYQNLYVSAAKSSANGHADDAPVAITPPRAAPRTGPGERDVLIVRQVALKEASSIVQAMMAAKPMARDDIVATVAALTEEFSAAVLRQPGPVEEEPSSEGPVEDSLFDEEL